MGVGYSQPFETQAQPRAEVALTAGIPNFSTLPSACIVALTIIKVLTDPRPDGTRLWGVRKGSYFRLWRRVGGCP